MKHISVTELAKIWGVSERTVRNYCALGKIQDAFLTGKTWNIPSNVERPHRTQKRTSHTLLERLQDEKAARVPGGLYHKIQVDLTYTSNHIEGGQLTHDQVRYMFETNAISVTKQRIKVDDIIEANNHFRCIDLIIEQAKRSITEKLIKQLHGVLKSGTSDSRKEWFAVGEYKKLPNEVGSRMPIAPEEASAELAKLLYEYKGRSPKTLEDLVEFHVRFERIHPFQDGNGRVGRLLLFKECLRYDIVPFIISDDLNMVYYRGLSEWNDLKDYLMDTCLKEQDRFRKVLEYYRITASSHRW